MKITKKHIIMFSFLSILFVIAWCSLNTNQNPTPNDNDNLDNKIENDTNAWLDQWTNKTLATVDWQAITSTEVSNMQQLFAQQGQQLSTQDALEQAIDQYLLIQQVTPLSNEETENMIEEQLALQWLSIDDYKKQIEAEGMSYDTQLENTKESFSIQNYIESTIGNDFDITDTEARAFYDAYKQQSPEELPPYEEIEQEIIMTLQQEKQQEALQEHIQELRTNADIKYN